MARGSWTASAIDFSLFCGATSGLLQVASTYAKYFSVSERARISATLAAIIARTPDAATSKNVETILWVVKSLLSKGAQV